MTSWSDVVDAILKSKNKEQARKVVSKNFRELRKQADWKKLTYRKAKALYLSNLGYFAGYYSPRTARKILDWAGAVHPIFGRMK